ncbi:MAG: macro domain-containing protein [Desulfopila sp.]
MWLSQGISITPKTLCRFSGSSIRRLSKTSRDASFNCLGPVYGYDQPSDKLLGSCYRSALQLAEENITSIAFRAIPTGAFGYPKEPATRITFKSVLEVIPRLLLVNHIRFVLFNDEARRFHERVNGFWRN